MRFHLILAIAALLMISHTADADGMPSESLITSDEPNAVHLQSERSEHTANYRVTGSFRFAENFKGIEDPLGGFGSDIYAYVKGFTLIDGELSEIEAGKIVLQPGDMLGWINRNELVAIRPIESTLEVNTEGVEPAKLLLSSRATLQVLIIPKSQEFLEEYDLEGLRYFGVYDWFQSFCVVIWKTLESIYKLTGSWGTALVLFTILIKVFTVPVSRYANANQTIASEQRERIHPKLELAKKELEGIDRSERIVEIYEEENYQHLAPLKALLAIFIQVPILLALFQVLGDSPELRGQSFLWINDLTVSDRLFALPFNLPFFGGFFNLVPVVLAYITWLAMRSGGSSVFASLGLALLYGGLFYTFPAALVIYWLIANFAEHIVKFIDNRIAASAEPK